MTATIETAHLRLEALADADVATLAGLWRDERVQQFLGGVLSPSDAQARASSVVRRWAVDGYGLWAVRDKATGGLSGTLLNTEGEVQRVAAPHGVKQRL